MLLRPLRLTPGVVVCLALSIAAIRAQAGPETFTATATVKTAAATASVPVTIVIERKMSQAEAEGLTSTFATGGGAALRKALEGVPATGSVRLGTQSPTPTRILLERPTDKGRLLTMVTDQPMLFLGAGLPGAPSKKGYDYAIVDIEVDEHGSGSGTLAPAARVGVKQGVFVVDDYASDLVRLVDVRKVR